MQEVTMYTTAVCPYCVQAKRILKTKGVDAITEVRIDLDPQARQDMMERTGRRTVPQIYIGTTHVGGCDDLVALDARQVTEFRLEHRQQLQHARPRGFRRLGLRQLAPDFTGEGFTVGATRDLSGQKNQFTAPYGWCVVSHRRRNGGQGQAQRGEALGRRRRSRAVGRKDQARDCQQTNHQGGFHNVFISVVVSRTPQRQNASGDGIVFGRLTALNSGAPHRVILNRERILDLNTRRITDRVKP